MRKAWIIVVLVVTLSLVFVGAGIALAVEPIEAPTEAPKLLQPVEPGVRVHAESRVRLQEEAQVRLRHLRLIVGEVINQPAEEGLIVVEGRMLRRLTLEAIPAPEPTEEVFTVMVDENTKYRVPEDRELSLEGVLEGDRVAIAAQELEDGSLLAKRVVVVPEEYLCLIVGEVINQPAEEGLIVVEGRMLRRLTLEAIPAPELTEQVFTVMVDENTKYRVPEDREPSLAGILNGDRVSIVAQELEGGSLLAKRVVVIPESLRIMRLRRALLIMDREREMMGLIIPQKQIVIIAKPIRIVPFSEFPFDQELLPFELPSLLEPQ